MASGARWPLSEPAEPISEYVFSGDLQSLRHAVAEDPIAGRLGRARRSDLVFVVSEAASNALKHGDGTGVVRLWGDEHGVVGEVATPSSLTDALAGRRRPEWDATDGRGLWLINQICDLVELRGQERTTVLRMHLGTAPLAFAGRARG